LEASHYPSGNLDINNTTTNHLRQVACKLVRFFQTERENEIKREWIEKSARERERKATSDNREGARITDPLEFVHAPASKNPTKLLPSSPRRRSLKIESENDDYRDRERERLNRKPPVLL
jgi:hypothetical protein